MNPHRVCTPAPRAPKAWERRSRSRWSSKVAATVTATVRATVAFAAAAVLVLSPALLHAQGQSQGKAADTTRAATPPRAPIPAGVTAQPRAGIASGVASPLTPKRAFLYSVMLPGLGQSRLDRGSSGALFASVELTALVMLRRVNTDLREARSYLADSLPANYIPAGDTVQGNGVVTSRYSRDLIRTRRLHVEDWLAVLAFNHLFAGADAFVAAQLFDMPVQLSAVPSSRGVWFTASVAF